MTAKLSAATEPYRDRVDAPWWLFASGWNRRKRRELMSTDTLDRDIAALASTGESCQPVHGKSTPAATGMPITLLGYCDLNRGYPVFSMKNP